MVADALSRKPYEFKDAHLQEEMTRLNVHIVPRDSSHKLSVQPTLEDRIRKAQGSDKDLMKIRKYNGENKAPDFRVDDKGTLWYKDRICVPKEGDFRQMIMDDVRPGAAGLLTGMEYSRVGSRTWLCPTSFVSTRIGVELVDVQGNYPTHSE